MHVGEDFAARHNMYFLETSAKEAENVEKLFMQIAEDLMEVKTLLLQSKISSLANTLLFEIVAYALSIYPTILFRSYSGFFFFSCLYQVFLEFSLDFNFKNLVY